MLWVDKVRGVSVDGAYRPSRLDRLVLHKDLGASLTKLVAAGDMPHTLFYGPAGAGKTTLMKATLRELYGPGVERVKVETTPWKVATPSRTVDVELTTLASNYHVELTPADAGNMDRYVVQEIIKEMAKSRPVDLMPGAKPPAAGEAGGPSSSRPTFKVLVLHEVDRLTRDAQAALRRTMERYAAGCRLVMTATSLSAVIDPLRSRCLCVRVPAPSPPELAALLAGVARKEGLTLPPDLADRVAAASGRSARRALLCLEACRAAAYPFTPGQAVERPDWETYVSEIAASALGDPSPKALYTARGQVYELLVNCIPPEVVLRTLSAEVGGRLARLSKGEVLAPQAAAAAAKYDARLAAGSKPVFHIEAYLARVMADVKGATG